MYPTPYILGNLEVTMLAKLTPENRLALPEAVLASCRDVEYFDVAEDDGRIVLTPMRDKQADAVRAQLADRGVTEADVADAVKWARGNR